MSGRRSRQDAPSSPDGDGVRMSRKPHDARRATWLGAAAVVVVVLGVTMAWSLRSSRPGIGGDVAAGVEPRAQDPMTAAGPPSARSTAASRSRATAESTPPAVDDPNDLAAWFEPGDPEPSGADVIGALHDAGIRTGIGAFNPPGTSPPLQGLAVPDGFDLPEGYVRHHQVTDAGVPLEPILMFSPDFVLRDARGRRIALPADGVVPPEYAPPGMPLRQARIPVP